jgi:hypothetical protein
MRLAALTVVTLAFATPSIAQEHSFVYASNDDAKIQAFASRGVPVDLMSNGITSLRLEPDGRSIEIFRETASPTLVRTFDSLQANTGLTELIQKIRGTAGSHLDGLDFVLIDDLDGIAKDDVGLMATIERDGRLYAWPSTNLVAWHNRTLLQYNSDIEDDSPTIIDVQQDLDRDAQVQDLRMEAEFLESTAEVLEDLYADADKTYPGLQADARRARRQLTDVASRRAALQSDLENLGKLHEMTAASKEVVEAALEGVYATSNAGMKSMGFRPVQVPDLRIYEDNLIQQMDEIGALNGELETVEDQEALLEKRLPGLESRLAQLENQMISWKTEAERSRAMAEVLRQRAQGLEAGELNVADWITSPPDTTVLEGWTYEPDIILGAHEAERLVELYGGWDAWEGIILHRVVNTLMLDPTLILALSANEEDIASPEIKAGWSEVAFLGTSFEESDLSLMDHEGLETGIGIFMSTFRSPKLKEMALSFFDRSEPRYVFPTKRMLSSGMPEELGTDYLMGLSDFGQLEGEIAHQLPTKTGTVEVGKLRWQDVPAPYLLSASSTTTGFLLLTSVGWQDPGTFLGPLFEFCEKKRTDIVSRDLLNLVRHMALVFDEVWWEWDEKNPDARRAAGLLPFAYLDMVTNFGLTEAVILGGNNAPGVSVPKMSTEYFSHIRPALQIAFDRNGLMLGGASMRDLVYQVAEYMVCATKFADDTGGKTPQELYETCWPKSEE